MDGHSDQADLIRDLKRKTSEMEKELLKSKNRIKKLEEKLNKKDAKDSANQSKVLKNLVTKIFDRLAKEVKVKIFGTKKSSSNKDNCKLSKIGESFTREIRDSIFA